MKGAEIFFYNEYFFFPFGSHVPKFNLIFFLLFSRAWMLVRFFRGFLFCCVTLMLCVQRKTNWERGREVITHEIKQMADVRCMYTLNLFSSFNFFPFS